ncbi:MAG: hypothetical protein Q9M41_09180 [Paracoccaceae bacterium]|nr:hypothetical protein [Paracoccaceae bacterium]
MGDFRHGGKWMRPIGSNQSLLTFGGSHRFQPKSTSASQFCADRVAPFQAKFAPQWWIWEKSRRDAAQIAPSARIFPSDQAIAAVKFITLEAIFASAGAIR